MKKKNFKELILSIVFMFGCVIAAFVLTVVVYNFIHKDKAENDRTNTENSCVTHDWVEHNGLKGSYAKLNSDLSYCEYEYCSVCKTNYSELAELKPWRTDYAGKTKSYWEWYENNGYSLTTIAEKWHNYRYNCYGKTNQDWSWPVTYYKPKWYECSKCHSIKTNDNSHDLNSDISQGDQLYDINGKSLNRTATEDDIKYNNYLWQNGLTAKYFTKSEFIGSCIGGSDEKKTDEPKKTDEKKDTGTGGSKSKADNTKGTWIKDNTGWWYKYPDGSYPANKWLEIDGKWYYFLASGYMDYSEYRDGYWLNDKGAWDERYSGGHWIGDNASGWWYTDNTGYVPKNTWLWINGVHYYFDKDGWCTNPY